MSNRGKGEPESNKSARDPLASGGSAQARAHLHRRFDIAAAHKEGEESMCFSFAGLHLAMAEVPEGNSRQWRRIPKKRGRCSSMALARGIGARKSPARAPRSQNAAFPH